MTEVDDRLLESKMTKVEQARAWSRRVISKFKTLIRSADDHSLYRVNPLAFARDRIVAGKRIGDYQAVGHRLADMAAQIEAAYDVYKQVVQKQKLTLD